MNYCSPRCLREDLSYKGKLYSYEIFCQEREKKNQAERKRQAAEKKRKNEWNDKNGDLLERIENISSREAENANPPMDETVTNASVYVFLIYGFFESESFFDFLFFGFLPYLLIGFGLLIVLLIIWTIIRNRYKHKVDKLEDICSQVRQKRDLYTKQADQTSLNLDHVQIYNKINEQRLPISITAAYIFTFCIGLAFVSMVSPYGYFRALSIERFIDTISHSPSSLSEQAPTNQMSQMTSNSQSWHCLCYLEVVRGEPTHSTACRKTLSQCEQLHEAIDRGTKVLVKGSGGKCLTIHGDYPWLATRTNQKFWLPSKKAGAWWSSRGCLLSNLDK